MIKLIEILRGGAQSLMMKGMPKISDRNSLMVKGATGERMGKLNLDDEPEEIDEIQIMENFSGFKTKAIIPMKNSTGFEIKMNDDVIVKWPQVGIKQYGGFSICHIYKSGDESKKMVVQNQNLYKYVRGVSKPPSDLSLEKMSDGAAKSVLGKRVEPDGYDEYGSPSWLLVLGYI